MRLFELLALRQLIKNYLAVERELEETAITVEIQHTFSHISNVDHYHVIVSSEETTEISNAPTRLHIGTFFLFSFS